MKNVIKKIVAKVKVLTATLRELLVKLFTKLSLRESKGTPAVSIVVTDTDDSSKPATKVKSFADMDALLEQIKAAAVERGKMFDPVQNKATERNKRKRRKSKTLRKRNNPHFGADNFAFNATTA